VVAAARERLRDAFEKRRVGADKQNGSHDWGERWRRFKLME
jgi:hypothetical protein